MSRTAPSRTPPSAADNAPTPLGRSAKRLSGWAANLLATAVVLAAGLTFGRQVLLWWRDGGPPPDVNVVGSPRMGELTSPHRLEFGGAPLVFQRETLTGDRRAALERLVANCRALAEAQPRPVGEAGPAQRALVQRLAQQPPVFEGDGFNIHQIPRPLPMAAALSTGDAPNGSAPHRRVVSWAVAMPVATEPVEQQAGASPPGDWTLFSWSAGEGLRAAPAIAPPLPPGGQQTLLVSAEDGSALAAFHCAGSPRDVMNFFDDHFARRSEGAPWRATVPWREAQGVWHARFEQARSGSVDVQLAIDADGAVSGLLTMSTPPHNNEE